MLKGNLHFPLLKFKLRNKNIQDKDFITFLLFVLNNGLMDSLFSSSVPLIAGYNTRKYYFYFIYIYIHTHIKCHGYYQNPLLYNM